MKSYFDIYQICGSGDRPPISAKVRQYFIEFIIENVLKEKRIIVESNWNVVLALIFLHEGARYTTTDIIFAKGGPRTIKSDRIKMYEAILPVKRIEQSKEPYLATIKLMYETITIFLTRTYKKVKPELMDALPYPAPLSEQKYAGDRLTVDGQVEIVTFKPRNNNASFERNHLISKPQTVNSKP